MMEETELMDLMKGVEEVLRCPMCMESVRTPVALCSNGHGTCSDCKNNLNACLICREPFSDIPMRMLDQLIDVLPKPCPFQECSEEYTMKGHRSVCVFRSITCSLGQSGKCRWTGNFKDWVTHLNCEHGKVKYALNINETSSIRSLNNWRSWGYVFAVDTNHFLLLTTRGDKTFKLTMKTVPFKKLNCQYYFVVTVTKDGEVMYKSKLNPEILTEDNMQTGGMEVLLEDVEDSTCNVDLTIKPTKKML